MTQPATATSPPRPADLDRELRRLGAVVVLGTIMTVLDLTIVNVAIPTLGTDLKASISTIQWVLTGSEEEGENGSLLPALEQILPDAYASRIDRHGIIDALADPAVVEALDATGRRQLITAGIGTEACGVAPALHAHRNGYQVAFVADACGSATALGHDISLRRLEHEGVTLTTAASVVAELAGNYPKYSEIVRG